MPAQVVVAIISPRQRQLNVLVALEREGARRRAALPHVALRPRETLDAAAVRACRSVLSTRPRVIRQVRAIEIGRTEPAVAIGYMTVCREADVEATPDVAWMPVDHVDALPSHHRALIAHTVEMLRRVDDPNLAFAMLPPRFTLAELQRVTEMIGGRKLHKASFRRSLLAAKLVEPTDTRRAEGRGRPAREFRFAGRVA